MPANDTIAALATAPGRGAVALIRLSGPSAFEIAERCLAPWPLVPRRATLASVHTHDTRILADAALAIAYPAPASFTGEDVVEVFSHGGVAAPGAVLAAFVHAGARVALPGEFTRRAVLHGKLDLLQAEAIGDLIDAPSRFMHREALSHLSGALTARIAALRDAVLELEALLAYDIDFPDEDAGPIPRGRIASAVVSARAEIARLLETLPAARLGREGAVVVLAGVPNAGKSSLFNALLGEQRVLVTDVPGTTRDAIDALIEGEPYPWRLVDTAGLRETTDHIEHLGVEVSHRWLARADVVLLCGATRAERDMARSAVDGRTDAAVVPVHTMADRTPSDDADAVAVSAVTGSGLHTLRTAVAETLVARYPRPPADIPMITRARHEAALREADAELDAFASAWERDTLPATVAAVHVRAAVHVLDVLIGAVDADDVLARVFERFCVGK